MKIVIIGNGKMGKQVAQSALLRGWEIAGRIDSDADWELINDLNEIQCAIEFSTPGTAPDNIKRCFRMGLPLVCGTTGWYERLDEIERSCVALNGSLLYAPNFSKGVNLFFAVNEMLARLMNAHSEYEVELTEFHHIHKMDAPSGTAIRLAEDLIKNLSTKTNWSFAGSANNDSIPIKSVRNGEIPGTHLIRWGSNNDEITLIHSARNRSIFADGALDAAAWLVGRKGVYTYTDALFDIK